MRTSIAAVALALSLCGSSACEPRRQQGPHRQVIVERERSKAGADCGSPQKLQKIVKVEIQPEAASARLEKPPQNAPRIPIPELEKEPTTRISIYRGKGPLRLLGQQLRLNGEPHDGAIDLRWTKAALSLDGALLPNETTVSAAGDITIPALGRYPGRLILYHNESHLLLVNEVRLERYVQSVVHSEVPAQWPEEAHKAQAVAARTYALARMALQSGQYSLESSVMDQVYRPGRLDPGVVAAVRATRGEVLIAGRNLVETKYHSTCGGRTEDPGEVWPELSMFRSWSTTCLSCKASPHYRWSLALSFTELTTRLSTVRPGLETIKGLSVTKRSGGHRALIIEVRSQGESFEMSGQAFRRAVSLRRVKSTDFEILTRRGGVLLKGRGFGHGVGMCQWGAAGMAKAGKSYREILEHYYSGTKLHRAYE